MIDPFGVVLSLIRGLATVVAIAGTRVGRRPVGGWSEFLPPLVELTDDVTSLRPYGPASGHLGLQRWTGFAKAYGDETETGLVAARNLAGAIVDGLDGHGAHVDGSRLLLRAWTPDISAPQEDPDKKWPFYVVRISGVFGRAAV